LSSFFYGYILTQIPGGWVATKFGGKYVYGVGVLVTSLLTLITPPMAYLNLWALVACRVAMGTVMVIAALYVCKTFSLNYKIGIVASCNECYVWKMGTTLGEKHDGNYWSFR